MRRRAVAPALARMVVSAVLSLLPATVACRPASDGSCTDVDHSMLFDAAGDQDGDQLDDGLEDAAARAYLPFLATHPEDACALSGIVFRARPHPDDAALVHVVYSRLYQRDCGLNGHLGDNEAFGVTIDPRIEPPAGLVAIVAISHEGTPCERVTSCGSCPGMPACDLIDGRPVLYASRDKHASVVDVGGGCSLGSCFDSCALPERAGDIPLVNVGEPDLPLITDLTDDGFINEDHGWTEQALLHVDPWGEAIFGDAGHIAGDLVDPDVLTPACTCDQ